MERRGLGSVITLALIVLGTVIGVSFLWLFINRNIERGGETIDPDCFTLNLQLLYCDAYGLCSYAPGAVRYEANILVNRGVGTGNMTSIRFIFEDPNGLKGVYDRDLNSLSLRELERLEFKEPYSIPVPNEPHLVRVVALLGKERKVCPVTSLSQTCNIIPTPPPLGSIPNNTHTPGSGEPYSLNPRGGNCCQWPANFSECYDSSDPNGILINGQLPPGVALPGRNRTVCCSYDPRTGP